jgi:hypothetical protein
MLDHIQESIDVEKSHQSQLEGRAQFKDEIVIHVKYEADGNPPVTTDASYIPSHSKTHANKCIDQLV